MAETMKEKMAQAAAEARRVDCRDPRRTGGPLVMTHEEAQELCRRIYAMTGGVTPALRQAYEMYRENAMTDPTPAALPHAETIADWRRYGRTDPTWARAADLLEAVVRELDEAGREIIELCKRHNTAIFAAADRVEAAERDAAHLREEVIATHTAEIELATKLDEAELALASALREREELRKLLRRWIAHDISVPLLCKCGVPGCLTHDTQDALSRPDTPQGAAD